jgi:threonyl-tRNA synthetase
VAGKFPVWIAPEQAILVTVTPSQIDYALKVASDLRAQGFRIKVDESHDKLGAKIRNARMMRVPYTVVIGDKEVEAEGVAPKTNTGEDLGPMKVAEFAARLASEAKAPRLAKTNHS